MDYNGDRYVYSIPRSFRQEEPSTEVKFSLWHTFKHHIPRFIVTIIFDLVLPLVLFLVLQSRIDSVYALLIAGIPPLVMIFLKAIISRSFDALGFLIFVAFVISAIVALATKSDFILLLEKSLITGVVAILFGITLIPCPCCHRFPWRPGAYYFYKDLLPAKRADVGLPDSAFDDEPQLIYEPYELSKRERRKAERKESSQVYNWIYIHCRSFRISCYIVTIIWAVGFLLEFLGRLSLILAHLTVEQIVIYGHVILGVITGICVILTIICIVIERKKTIATIKQWKQGQPSPRRQRLRRLDYSVWMSEYSFPSNDAVHKVNNI